VKAFSKIGEMIFQAYNELLAEEVKNYTEQVVDEVYSTTPEYQGVRALDYTSRSNNNLARKRRANEEGVVTYTINLSSDLPDAVIKNTCNTTISDAVRIVQTPSSTGNEFLIDEIQSAELAIVTDSTVDGCNLPDGTARLQCDTTSTTCVSEGLTATCQCKDGFYSTAESDTTCLKQFCNSNSDCNNGICDKEAATIYSCKCNWGYSGSNCNDAWLLAFTILIPLLGVALIVVVLLWVRASRKAKKAEKTKPNVYQANPFEMNHHYEEIKEKSSDSMKCTNGHKNDGYMDMAPLQNGNKDDVNTRL